MKQLKKRRSLLPFHRSSRLAGPREQAALPRRGASRPRRPRHAASREQPPAGPSPPAAEGGPRQPPRPAHVLLRAGEKLRRRRGSKQARTRGAGGRAGGRAGWPVGVGMECDAHAAAPPTPVLVTCRLDATAVRDPGCLVAWRARAALVACTVRPTRCRTARTPTVRDLLESVAGRQCSWSAAPSTTVLSAGHALPGSRTFARGQA